MVRKRLRFGISEQVGIWLTALGTHSPQDAARIRNSLKTMEKTGILRDGHQVDGRLWELRWHHGPGYRIYYVQHGASVYLLLAAGTKRTQQRDIEQARQALKAVTPLPGNEDRT